MYTFESRVRFSEAGHTELLTLPGLVNYFQDCSTFQSEDIGYGVESLKKSGQAWILSAWQIVVNRYPKLGEHIRVSTWATDFTGLFGLRNFKTSMSITASISRWQLMWCRNVSVPDRSG